MIEIYLSFVLRLSPFRNLKNNNILQAKSILIYSQGQLLDHNHLLESEILFSQEKHILIFRINTFNAYYFTYLFYLFSSFKLLESRSLLIDDLYNNFITSSSSLTGSSLIY